MSRCLSEPKVRTCPSKRPGMSPRCSSGSRALRTRQCAEAVQESPWRSKKPTDSREICTRQYTDLLNLEVRDRGGHGMSIVQSIKESSVIYFFCAGLWPILTTACFAGSCRPKCSESRSALYGGARVGGYVAPRALRRLIGQRRCKEKETFCPLSLFCKG